MVVMMMVLPIIPGLLRAPAVPVIPRAASASVLISPTDPEDLLEASYCVLEVLERRTPARGTHSLLVFLVQKHTGIAVEPISAEERSKLKPSWA